MGVHRVPKKEGRGACEAKASVMDAETVVLSWDPEGQAPPGF
jgi:hypothetical protein